MELQKLAARKDLRQGQIPDKDVDTPCLRDIVLFISGLGKKNHWN